MSDLTDYRLRRIAPAVARVIDCAAEVEIITDAEESAAWEEIAETCVEVSALWDEIARLTRERNKWRHAAKEDGALLDRAEAEVDRLRTTAPHLGGAVTQHDWTADTLAGALREADVSLGLGIDCEVYGRRFRFDTVAGCWVEVCEECDGRGESVEGAPCECRAPAGGAL